MIFLVCGKRISADVDLVN